MYLICLWRCMHIGNYKVLFIDCFTKHYFKFKIELLFVFFPYSGLFWWTVLLWLEMEAFVVCTFPVSTWFLLDQAAYISLVLYTDADVPVWSPNCGNNYWDTVKNVNFIWKSDYYCAGLVPKSCGERRGEIQFSASSLLLMYCILGVVLVPVLYQHRFFGVPLAVDA